MSTGIRPFTTTFNRQGRTTIITLIQALLIAGIIMLPLSLLAYTRNPPLALTGAPGESTCAGCHSPLSVGSGVTVTFPGGMTYTPGGPAIPLTVAVTSGNGGFELSSRVATGNTQAGSLAAGAASGVSTSGGIQYAFQTSRATSWTLQWTPPATNVGNVIVYVVGVAGQTFSRNYTLTPAVTAPATLSASPASLSFSYNGALPPTQTVQATSGGAPIAVTTSVSTATGGNWLTATPPGGNTPLGISVSVNPAGLSAGTYTGAVSVASSGASNSPRTIPVTFTVNATPPPTVPSMTLGASSLTFDVATGGTALPQVVTVTSTGTPILFTTSVSTQSGGNWLAADSGGTSPAPISVSISTAGLAGGAYLGAVTFTSTDASNSPLTLPVTLNVKSPQPPPTTEALKFSFNVVARQRGGSDRVLLSGSGNLDGSGKVTGSGRFTRYAKGDDGDDDDRPVSLGTWTATKVVSFEPIPDSNSGGVLVLEVSIRTAGAAKTTGTLTIASKGDNAGVTLVIRGGATFTPTDIGTVKIKLASGGNGDDDDEDEDEDEDDEREDDH